MAALGLPAESVSSPYLSPAVLFAALAVMFVTTWLLTGWVYAYARRRLLDVPNERSLHAVPTPRGGGLPIVLTWSVLVTLLTFVGLIPLPWSLAWLGGGVLVAGIGWVDDHRSVAAPWRLLVHFGAAAWAVFWLGGPPNLQVGPWFLPLGLLGVPLAVVALVWLTNLYNFMDGIDGLAGTETLTVTAVAGTLLWWSEAPALALSCWALASASAGFLSWNWPPAKIFMGDVGSGWLGFTLGTLALVGERSGTLPALVWLILLSVFVWDATFTLLQRVWRRQRWYNPHRAHAYQRAVQGGMSHRAVTLAVLALNLLVLGPAAALGWAQPRLMLGIVVLTVLTALLLWRKVQRWAPERR